MINISDKELNQMLNEIKYEDETYNLRNIEESMTILHDLLILYYMMGKNSNE